MHILRLYLLVIMWLIRLSTLRWTVIISVQASEMNIIHLQSIIMISCYADGTRRPALFAVTMTEFNVLFD